jgi:DNA-binding XRE family transcriptional regulator
MQTQWNGAYQTISAVVADWDRLTVRFENGDEVSVQQAALSHPAIEAVLWQQARVGAQGLTIVVPAQPAALEIPWDIVRRLTDPSFARYLSELASEQAQHLGQRLRQLRERRQLTQAKVAAAARIEPANLSRIENGRFDISTSTLWKLLAAMGYSPADLQGVTADAAVLEPVSLAASTRRPPTGKQRR